MLDVANYLVQNGIVERAAVEVYVAFAEGPDQFWLHKKSDEVAIALMRADLNQLYNSPNSAWALPSFSTTVGSQLYATRYSDGVSYRVQLILIKENAVGEAHFVDYVDSHEVPLANLHPLPSKWQAISPFAQLQLPNKRNNWSQAIVEFFKRNCRPEMVLKAVLGVKEGDVQLVESLVSSNGEIVSRELVMISAVKSGAQSSVQSIGMTRLQSDKLRIRETT